MVDLPDLPHLGSGPPEPRTVPLLVTDAGATKRALRRRIRAERAGRTEPERRFVAEALRGVLLEMPELRRANCVSLYASTPGEPDTALVRAALRDLGTRVLLPVALLGGELDWAEDDGTTTTGSAPRVPGLPPVPEPEGPRLGRDAIADAEVVILPALAVDTLGNRLGQGGGYYDRALPRAHPAALVLAIVHDDELLDAAVESLPVERHDHRVDAVVTPTRWMRLRLTLQA